MKTKCFSIIDTNDNTFIDTTIIQDTKSITFKKGFVKYFLIVYQKVEF